MLSEIQWNPIESRNRKILLGLDVVVGFLLGIFLFLHQDEYDISSPISIYVMLLLLLVYVVYVFHLQGDKKNTFGQMSIFFVFGFLAFFIGCILGFWVIPATVITCLVCVGLLLMGGVLSFHNSKPSFSSRRYNEEAQDLETQRDMLGNNPTATDGDYDNLYQKIKEHNEKQV